MKLNPGPAPGATIRAAVASSVAPPNIMVPRHSGETFSPLRPNDRYSMAHPLLFPLSTLHRTGLNGAMGNRPRSEPPSLASLFGSFVSIGMMSLGGGLAAWTRREVVQKRGW